MGGGGVGQPLLAEDAAALEEPLPDELLPDESLPEELEELDELLPARLSVR